MHSTQKGWLPVLVIGLSYLFPFLMLIDSLVFLFDQEELTLTVVVTYLAVMLFFPLFFGMFAASFFPTIEIRKHGLNISFWGIFSVNLTWDEIDSVVYYPNGYIILRTDKKGIALFNGLYFYSLQAKILRSRLPTVVLSPWLEKRNEIMREVIKNSSPREVHKPS